MADVIRRERVVFMTIMALGVLGFIQRAAEVELTTGGWVFMIGAWTAIISLVIFCFSKVLRNRKK
jgi:hypothetical protein